MRARSERLKSQIRRLSAKVKPWRETEIKEIRRALKKAQGDKIIAAALLEIGTSKIWRKLKSGA